jgi:hypothetical protein
LRLEINTALAATATATTDAATIAVPTRLTEDEGGPTVETVGEGKGNDSVLVDVE